MIKGPIRKPDLSTWHISCNRFVAFLDIMGFKDFIMRNNQQVVYEMMRKIVQSLDGNLSFYGYDDPEEGNESSIFITTYSDSIIIYSKDDQAECVHRFVHSVSSVCEDLYLQKVPFKGAIAEGIMTLDFKNNIFFGQPLVDAYTLHEELLFYGVVVHGSAENSIKIIKSNVIYEYSTPFKGGAANHLTILPINFFPGKIHDGEFKEFLEGIKGYNVNTSGSLRKYVDNTILFFQKANASNFPL
jgi:hypothetical protein